MPDKREKGPLTLVLACPAVEAFGPAKLVGRNEPLVNTAPKAGQRWDIHSAAYSFPGANRNNTNILTGLKLNFTFHISMSIAGVVVAEQEILESQNANEPKEEEGIQVPAVGSLEPFAPAALYAGMGLSFLYSVSKSAVSTTFITSGIGKIVLTYTLVY